jgi:acyl carrier protein
MNPKENAQVQITDYLRKTYLFGSDFKLSEDDSFLEHGIVDSTGILELIGFLQNNFKVNVEDSEVIPENLDSINCILSFLERKGVRY